MNLRRGHADLDQGSSCLADMPEAGFDRAGLQGARPRFRGLRIRFEKHGAVQPVILGTAGEMSQKIPGIRLEGGRIGIEPQGVFIPHAGAVEPCGWPSRRDPDGGVPIRRHPSHPPRNIGGDCPGGEEGPEIRERLVGRRRGGDALLAAIDHEGDQRRLAVSGVLSVGRAQRIVEDAPVRGQVVAPARLGGVPAEVTQQAADHAHDGLKASWIEAEQRRRLGIERPVEVGAGEVMTVCQADRDSIGK